MIPYFQLTTFDIGPITLQAWGVMVALGFLGSIFLIQYRLKKLNLKHQLIWDFALAGIIGAIIGARLFHVLFYRWQYYHDHVLETLYFWTPGYSFFGGLVGAALGVILIQRLKKVNFFSYADPIAFALPLGLAIGRLGCFFIHDHPGIHTNFFLGVRFADGARWDLGLMQALVNLVLFIAFLLLARKKHFPGFYVSVFFIYYAVTRFCLDFLRVWDGPMAETRYAALTPAQYFSIALFAIGIFIIIKYRKQKHGAL